MKVLGHGPLNAKIVIVGEAPGREEEIEGRPFVGASGRLLTTFLNSAGIDRSACYITNVVKERPPSNDFGIYYEDKKRNVPKVELQEAWTSLQHEILRIKPNLTIAVGGEALRALVGKRSIDSWRGSILDSPVGKVIGTFHPAYILRQYVHHPILELDLKRCRVESECVEVKTPAMSFVINPSLDQVLTELHRLQQVSKVVLDIETTRGGLIRCVGLSDRIGWAIVIPFCSSPRTSSSNSTFLSFDPAVCSSGSLNSHWSEEEEMMILVELKKLLESPHVGKLGQNLAFDSTHLAIEFGINTSPIISDTMLGFHTLYSELPKGLDFLVSIYTRIPYYSNYDPGSDESTWTYCAYDCAGTYEVEQAITQDLRESQLLEFYASQVMEALPTYTRAGNRGVLIDQTERTKQAAAIKVEIEKLTLAIKSQVGDVNFNPSSPKQVGAYLYGKLGLPVQLHHKTRQPTTDKNAMEALARKYPNNPIFPLLQDHSSKETILSGFYQIPLGPDSRIYTSFNVAGTVTGRLSSASSIIFSASTNLQNIKKPDELEGQKGEHEVDSMARRCFVSDPGWSLIKADYAQAEFWIVVWDARIHRLIDRYINEPDFDVHRWVASLINNIPESQVTKAQRSIAKNGVYGGNYEMGYITAARTYKIPLSVAKWVLDSYRRAIPEIPQWWETVQVEVNSSRSTIGPLGRKRMYFDRLDHDLYKQAYSHKAQHLVGDLITRAANIMDNTFDERECHLLMQVHDELVPQARDDVVESYARRVKSIMEHPVKFPGVDQPLVLRADVSIGKNWMDTVKLKESI